MFKYSAICALTLVGCFVSAAGQCISANDTEVNEISVEEAVRTLTDGSKSFSLKLFRVLNSAQQSNANSDDGLFFSPFSIWSALMVTYTGAKGATEEELRSVLGLGNVDKVTAWATYRDVQNWDINSRNQQGRSRPGYRLANRVFFQEDMTVRDCVRELLGPDIGFVNFENQLEESRQVINTWVEQKTEQRINNLIPSGGISSNTRMAIANAVYFKESWLQEFDPSQTRRRRFMMAPRKKVFVDMMNVMGTFRFGVSEELRCKSIELPYTGNRMSMVILLPNKKFYRLDKLINRLTPERLKNTLRNMYFEDVLVSIPKFHMEDGFELKATLRKLGLRNLIDAQRVDLSGFTGQRDLTVGAVYHKTFIDVNEQGTEAAGATAMVMPMSLPPSFIANHPFVFLIKDNISDVILFMGTVRKPTEATHVAPDKRRKRVGGKFNKLALSSFKIF